MSSQREVPIDLHAEEFRKIGYSLVDSIADLLNSMETRPVTPGESPRHLQELLGNAPLPENGSNVEDLVQKSIDLMIDHSLFNGHPKFLGYITSSPAPLGILADLLAAGVNPNVGGHILSPIATEIEKQTIRWLAEFIGVSPDYGGILVSGGNMANLTAFVAGRTAKAGKESKKTGLSQKDNPLIVYCSKATHTWIDKAADLFGMGTNAIRWIATDDFNRIDLDILEETIKKDLSAGGHPIMVIGTAVDVSTGLWMT
jgi:glutamate/tyrosine decarboxylase-like PLP-dependent enzyme